MLFNKIIGIENTLHRFTCNILRQEVILSSLSSTSKSAINLFDMFGN